MIMLHTGRLSVRINGERFKILFTEWNGTRLGATPHTRRTQTMGEKKYNNDSNTDKEKI